MNFLNLPDWEVVEVKESPTDYHVTATVERGYSSSLVSNSGFRIAEYFKAARPRCGACGGLMEYTGGWAGSK